MSAAHPVTTQTRQSMYDNPQQQNPNLPCAPADRYMLAHDHTILPMFDAPATEPAPGGIMIRGVTWNVEDPAAARVGNDTPIDDDERYQSTMQAQVCRQSQVPFLLMQETSLESVQNFYRCGYGVTGQYCTADNTPGQYRMLYHGWGFPGRKSETPWTETAARADARENGSWWTNTWRSIADSKLDWTGLSIAFDRDTYEPQSSEFRRYQAQRGIGSSFHALGATLGLVNPDDGTEGNFSGFKNSSSGVCRTDGLLIAKLRKRDNSNIWLINTHLESFHHDIRARQLKEFRDEVNTIAHANPNDWICFGGDFNRPQSGENGYDDLYGSFVWNQDFADGRCIGMPRSQIRETFPEEKSLDGLYFIPPKTYRLIEACGQTLIPGRQPKESRREPPDVRAISDHCAVSLHAVFEPTGTFV